MHTATNLGLEVDTLDVHELGLWVNVQSDVEQDIKY